MSGLDSLLEGKRALFIGGAVNIGRAVALTLARADVAVIYRNNAEAAAETFSRIEAQGRRGPALKTDITREEEVKGAFSRLSEEWGGLDILVNNSGICSIFPQAELPLEEWNRVWGVNMGGLFLCSREALPLLTDGGSVVNLASINAFHSGFGETAHSDMVRRAEERTPLRALIKPEDVADTELYPTFPLASQMTGQTLIADGGYLLS